jgi:diguanylate cyclase (GGDEF)-like protein
MMAENSLIKRQLDLTAAKRILENAGRPDPTRLSDNSDEQIQSLIDVLCDLSMHDGLTGLVNASFFHAVLAREIDRSSRTGRHCALMVIDIDHFKNINDTYGHSTGDSALKSVAIQMRRSLRTMDTAARIGGEEFAVILPECEPDDAINVARRIHSLLNPLALTIDLQNIKLTTSVGLVWTDFNAPKSAAALLAQADQEMYRAKRTGRGRLCYPASDTTQISGEERSALLIMKIEGEANAG